MRVGWPDKALNDCPMALRASGLQESILRQKYADDRSGRSGVISARSSRIPIPAG
ncbi:hypothetical protein KCP73_16270 [Salmonella enterica subsp. enterica]|nr:hypothetical protein KCP73_16270 [Salmonella enterica subsp. enterica]